MVTSLNTPFCLRIGITGHRTLHSLPKLTACLDKILITEFLEAFSPEARNIVTSLKTTPVQLTFISPLAEGADRLAANAALQNGCTLEALLPMPKDEYEKDFVTQESRREFDNLLAKAHRITVVKNGKVPLDVDYRSNAYLNVGTETVNRCDILIALWDGKPSRGTGGTADIVALALKQNKPVFIVSTEEPGTIELRNGGVLMAENITELDRFNSFSIDDAELQAACEKDFIEIFPSPQADMIPGYLKEIVKNQLLPPYCRASKIASKFQKSYKLTGKLGYIFSTSSVAFMAFAVIFAKHPLFSIPSYIAELLLLISLYLMIHRAEHARVHPGWLENRVLAERLRTAFYFVACGEMPDIKLKGHSIHHHSQNWVDQAYQSILSMLPPLARPEDESLQPYRHFVDSAWIQGQVKYHTDKAATLSGKNNNLKYWGMLCFKIAITVSLIHLGFALFGAATGHHLEGTLLLLEELLSVVAITLPAAGAAFGGYRSLLEQSRIAARSRSMAQHLTRLSQQEATEDAAEFHHYLVKIEKIMLIESEDWLALMEHAELERIA